MSKVMLVEDDNNLREIYEARLRAEGYDIVSARDGEEALVVAKAQKPELIIADVMMPKISGFEMLDILRNTDGLKDVKVIMLTALGQSDDQQRAQKLGADRYLVKSQVTLEDIAKTVHELLGDGGDTEAAPAADASTKAPDEPPALEPATAPPAQSPPATNSMATNDTPSSAPPVSAAATTASDDKVMADAVDSLVADTEKQSDAVVAPSKTVPQSSTVDDDTAKEEEDTNPAKASDKDKPDDNHNTVIANKKVIQPIDTEPEKDLEALAALEEAKEAGIAGATIVQPSPATNPSAVASNTTASSAVDEEAAVDAKIEDFVAGATTEPNAPIAEPSTSANDEGQATDTATASPASEPSSSPATPLAELKEVKQTAAAVTPIVVSEVPADKPATPPPVSAAATPAAQADDAKPPLDPNNIAL